MRRFLVALLFGLVTTAPSPAAALPPICFGELPRWFAREQRIPVGCEVIDCCPNCPANARIDWRVTLAGEAIGGAEIRVPGADAPHSLGPGETRLASIGSAHAAEPATLATLRLEPDGAVLEGWAASIGTGEPLGEISVMIDQLVGDEVVNHFSLGASFIHCLSTPTLCDDITLNGNLDGDEAVVHIDGRRPTSATCSDDEVRRAAAILPAGNLLTSAGCYSEVGIYSKANAMAMRKTATVWSDLCGDHLTVDLDPILEIPATFFLAIPDALAKLEWDGKTTEEVAREDHANANQLFDENKTGISFGIDVRTLTVVEAATLLVLVPAAIVSGLLTGVDPGTLVCSLPSEFEALGLYVPNRLNIYYLPVLGTGMECPDDLNVVFIALNKKPETLAHEFGHGLSLYGGWGHTNTATGFDSSNLMWTGSIDVRDHISLGQAFRMNLESHSILNTDGVRSGPTRICPSEPPPYPDPAACPALDLDWVRP